MANYTTEQIEAERKRLAALPENQNEEGGITAQDAIRSLDAQGGTEGADDPRDRFRKELRQAIEQRYGPRVADALITQLAGQFAQVTGTPAEQEAQIPRVLAAIDGGGYLEAAIETDRKDRRKQFETMARTALLLPVATGTPQDNVTLAAIDRLIGQYADEYELDYQNMLAQGTVPGIGLMGDSIASSAAGVMARARPEVSVSNPISITTKLKIQESAAMVEAEAQRLDKAEKDFDRYKRELEVDIDAAINAIGVDDTGAKAKLQDLRLNGLSNPALRKQYIEMNRLAPTPADAFLDAEINPLLRRAVAGTPFAAAFVEGDVLNTLTGIRGFPKAEADRKKQEGDAAEFDSGAAAKLQAAELEIPGTAERLANLNPQAILDAAGGNKEVANNILKTLLDAAKAAAKEQNERGKTFEGILGPVDASGKPTQDSLYGGVDPALREALTKGVNIWGQGAFGSVVKGSGLYGAAFGNDEAAGNAFISGTFGSNAEFGKDPGAALSEAQKRLVQQARDQGRGGDAAVLQAAYGIRGNQVEANDAVEAAIERARQAGDQEGEHALRSRLPGFKTRAEQMGYIRTATGFKEPSPMFTGTGRDSLAYQTQGLAQGDPRRADLLKQIEDLDAKQAEAARQTEQRRNPLPRGRKS